MIKAIVTDIEGTTTALSFVKDVLFPYARQHLADFVRSHADTAEIKILLAEVQQIVGKPLTDVQLVEQFIDWIDKDEKITPLKSLQGLIWQAGYQQNHFNGHLYSDVATALKKWHEQGIALYIYSSGSVQAQKLLFAHTEAGDLTGYFSGYFDTHIGGKKDSASYQNIATQINLPTQHILFLSDMTEELDAARQVGFATIQLVRDHIFDSQATHPQVDNFAAITL